MDEKFLKSEIENDIDYRSRTLDQIKTIPTRYWFLQGDIPVWRRCVFPIIYAEWEGFFANATQLYFREINKHQFKLEDLSGVYFVGNVEKKFSQFKEYPKDIKKKENFLVKLLLFLRDTGDVTVDINTSARSNLNFQTLNNVLRNLGLKEIEDNVYHNKYSLKDDMNTFLLYTRNLIAHGQNPASLSNNDVTKAIDLVKLLMNLTKNSILQGFHDEVFKKKIPISSKLS